MPPSTIPPQPREDSSSGKPDVVSIRGRIFSPTRRSATPRECLHEFSDAVDGIVDAVFSRIDDCHRNGLCAIALGGYGRGEMWPFSDVDLMLLYREDIDLDVVKAFERNIWDLGLAVGFSARTLPECASILGDDCATDTALLDARRICGDSSLMLHLTNSIIRPFFKRRKKTFINDMVTTLNAGLNSPNDSLYRIEPDIKNGICCLRDCHRIRWAEMVDKASNRQVGSASGKTLIADDDRQRLEKSYSFLSAIRSELHMAGGRRIDILEVALQPRIAESAGFTTGGAAALMGEFFNAVTEVRHAIMSMSENIASRRRTFGALRSAIASFDAGNNLRVIDGFLHTRSTSIPVRDAEWIMTVFTTALTCNTGISTGLRNMVREAARTLSAADFRDPAVEKSMCDILSAISGCGRIIDLMHDTGVLGLVLPEFAPLTCRFEFDSYHEYTVDQHSLMALRAFEEAADDDDKVVRMVRFRIENLRVLRLALLLHDAGKAIAGDHCRSGAIIIRNAATRIGFTDSEQFQAAFLVYHHLDLSELSFRRELRRFSIRHLAEVVATTEMLDMLYLLTVLDIRHVGSKTWTGWKAMQLSDIYAYVRNILLNQTEVGTKNRIVDESEAYMAATMPEDRPKHEQWLDQLGSESILVHTENFTGFYRVSIVTRDRISLLADIAACFVAAGLQIISARVNSFSGSGIVDVFDVEIDPTIVLTFDERIERFKLSWNRLVSGEVVSNDIVETRIRHYPRKPQRRVLSVPTVSFNSTDSTTRTILEVRAPDRFGLFFTIVNAISSCGININSARIATSADEAADVFYVSDQSNNKITDQDKLEKVKLTLLDALGEK